MVTRLWPGETIVCLGTGPSLTREDVDYCRGRARVIAIKQAVELAPWADVLYSSDVKFWKHYGPTLTFQGLRYALGAESAPSATVLRNAGEMGLEPNPDGLRTGRNSGYAAIGLAVHLGAKKIVLLGYDLQPDKGRQHWFGAHPWVSNPAYATFLMLFAGIVEPLRALGVQVLNATRRTALRCFPCVSLEEALA